MEATSILTLNKKGSPEMEANKTHSNEIRVYSRSGANMEANNILILNMKEYELFSIAYHNMRQQKCGVILEGAKMEANKTYSSETGVYSR